MTFRHMLFIVGSWCEEYDNQPVFYQRPTITPVHRDNMGGFCSCVTNHTHSGHTRRVTSDSHRFWDPYKLLYSSYTFPYCLAAWLVAWSRSTISCALLGCYFISLSFPTCKMSYISYWRILLWLVLNVAEAFWSWKVWGSSFWLKFTLSKSESVEKVCCNSKQRMRITTADVRRGRWHSEKTGPWT